jgi:crotonobetainyl-CoA:carnitine CoA-transferase CaiB-like acyl-CoA transferase
MFPEALTDYILNGRVHGTVGNRDIHGAAPAGVYRCRGDDRWLALTVTSDAAWAGLCEAMGRPDLAGDPRFATAADRLARHDDLDRLVGAWTSEHDGRALMLELQARGVPAGPVMDPRDCYEDPHIRERGYFETITHKDTGTYPWPGMPFKFSGTPLSIRRPPRDLGEDNEYVYKTLLGVSDEEYARLEAAGHIGTEYAPDVT